MRLGLKQALCRIGVRYIMTRELNIFKGERVKSAKKKTEISRVTCVMQLSTCVVHVFSTRNKKVMCNELCVMECVLWILYQIQKS